MSIIYLYGNKKPIGYRAVEAYYGCIQFRMTRETSADFSKQIDNGLIVKIDNDHGQQEFKFERGEYRVVPNEGYHSFDVHLEDKHMGNAMKLAIDVNGFLHRTTDTAVALASSLAGTIAHQFATPYMKRKRVVVYLRSDPTVLAHLLIRSIGLSRFEPNISVGEFYQRYTPEVLFESMCSWFRNKDIDVVFKPHDGKKREAFVSLIGEATIEFAEQA